MTQITGFLTASVQTLPNRYGSYLNKPPIVITTLAQNIHESDSAWIDTGRYHKMTGSIVPPAVHLGTDTYLQGDTGHTGRAFALESGVAGSNYRDPVYDLWGIDFYDGTTGASYSALAVDSTAGIENAMIVLRRGPCPPGVVGTPANCYTIVNLNAGQTEQIQVSLRYNEPVSLQYSRDSGATFRTYNTLVNQAGQEVMFSQVDLLVLYVRVHKESGLVTIDTNLGGVLKFQPPDGLPSVGRVRIKGMNGWTKFAYQPYRYGTVAVGRDIRLEYPHPQAAAAWLTMGSLTQQPGVTWGSTVTPSGSAFSWTSTGHLPDAGEGKGSADPVYWTDAQLIIPADWLSGIPGGVNPTTISILSIEGIKVYDILNDNQRTRTMDADALINNFRKQYTAAAANLAFTLYSSNNGGASNWKLVDGVCGVGDDGFELDNPSAGINKLRFRVNDRSVVMGNSSSEPVTLPYDVQVDLWCRWSAVRYFCHLGNISDAWLTRLPDYLSTHGIYVPPGAPGTYAPYGRAATDGSCPYPILGNGSGDNPLLLFQKGMTPWQCLQQLVQDISDPVFDGDGNLIDNIPYYMGFDEDSYFRFEPYSPALLTPLYGITAHVNQATISYPSVTWVSPQAFKSSFSISQLRSEVSCSGEDLLTNELLIDHREQSPAVKEAIGYYRPASLQQERWGTQGYLSTVTDGYMRQTSLPTALVAGRVPHLTRLYAGDVVVFWHEDLGLTPKKFYMTKLIHTLVTGAQEECSTDFFGRFVGDF